MQPKKMRFALVLFFAVQTMFCLAATVDSIDVQSAVMNKTYKAAVVLPASYAKSKAAYPVLYLLHGGGGHFRDWLTSTPDKMLVKNLADQFNLIVVMPEGETFSWYIDSPLDKSSQFETYITKEVIDKIDNTYRTVRSNKGRVITGLSMGGHGALYLSAKHPDLFCAAGSMSGAVDMNPINWRIPAGFATQVKQGFQKLVGDTTNAELYASYSVLNMADQLKKSNLKLIIDCGVDDFLIEANRELHRRLVYNHTPHDYTERPGAHTWPYWQNSLPYHVLFFYQVLKENGVTVSL
jgi:S-formylglutathione hydrolase FrmB